MQIEEKKQEYPAAALEPRVRRSGCAFGQSAQYSALDQQAVWLALGLKLWARVSVLHEAVWCSTLVPQVRFFALDPSMWYFSLGQKEEDPAVLGNTIPH